MFKKIGLIALICAFIIGAKRHYPVMAAEKVDVRKMAEYLAQYLVSVRRMIAQLVDVINTHGAKVGEPPAPGSSLFL